MYYYVCIITYVLLRMYVLYVREFMFKTFLFQHLFSVPQISIIPDAKLRREHARNITKEKILFFYSVHVSLVLAGSRRKVSKLQRPRWWKLD